MVDLLALMYYDQHPVNNFILWCLRATVNVLQETDALVFFRKNFKNKRIAKSLTGLTFKQFEILLQFFEAAKLKSQKLRLQNKEIKRITNFPQTTNTHSEIGALHVEPFLRSPDSELPV